MDLATAQQTAEDLAALETLLARPAAWMQHPLRYAETAEGDWAAIGSPGAARWCLVGGVQRVTADQRARFHALLSVLGFSTDAECEAVTWSETPGRTQADVLSLIRQRQHSLAATIETLQSC